MSFLTPILARFNAELESAVETATANILRELQGVSQASTRKSAARPEPWDLSGTLAPRSEAGGERPKGQKRTPEALALKGEEVFALIKRHPGLRIEQLAERSGMSTNEMSLPIKKLRAAKRITTLGEKRATTYRVK